VLISSYASNLRGSLMGTGLILLGLPVLWFVRKLYPKEQGLGTRD
jgi:APA family basic amino acid/polyamine antiporter